MQIEIHQLSNEEKKVKFTDEKQLGFGKIFTDHMFFAQWKEHMGWYNAQIKQYAPLTLDPSALIFHYGQGIFEGLKAYKWADQTVALFRPEMNVRRFNLSADRLCMPTVPEQFFLEALEKLVALEQEWIPSSEGTSLYIRPTMIATDTMLGVRPSTHYYFYIILSPVGPYYLSGYNPIKMLVENRYVRATPGGTGEVKTGCNYGGSLKAAQNAKNLGFDQVLWLDSTTRSYIEEAGVMNIFFVYQEKLVTPQLDGSILGGITRDSILKIAEFLGFQIEERRISIHEIVRDISSGKLKEAFCCGTAAVVTPVGAICYKEQNLVINENKVGKITQQLYDILTQIYYGKVKDPFGWIKKIYEPTHIHSATSAYR